MKTQFMALMPLAALALGAAAPAAPKKAARAAWELTYSAYHDHCFLSTYYRGEGLTVLMIGTSLAGPVIVVGNRSWRVPAGGRTRLTLRFDGSPTPVSIDAKNEVGATYQGYAGDGDASLLGHVGGASAVRILAGDGRQLDYLELPELGPALDRLKDCATELGPLIMMGVHEEGRFADAPIPPYPRRATADLGDIITAADYPAQALAAGQEGIVRFANDIDPQGRMRCRVTASSGWPLLDARTCELFEARAKYEHALDSDGHPTTDTRIGSYVWRLKDARGQ